MKTLRFIGMALLAIALSWNFASCSDDDKDELIEDVQDGNEDENGNESEDENEDGLIKTIHVEEAGTLKDLMTEEEQSQVTDLTLSGFLNATDIGFIRGMTNLAKADFTDAHIVEGGETYSVYYYNVHYILSTYDNIFPYFCFFGFASLHEIKLPNSVTEIGYDAFHGCSSLTTIEIPNSITVIGAAAFYYCTSLETVEIPNSVTVIKDSAFSDCTSLATIEIPNSVTEIELYAFYNCSSLTTIEIPNSVTEIGDYAFYWCPLKEIHVKGATPPNVYSSTFSTYDYATLYVPTGSKDVYMEDSIWGMFSNIIEE